ncbi:MAG: ArnT family glycosyltransferase [Tepidisphaeraceae bacterium]
MRCRSFALALWFVAGLFLMLAAIPSPMTRTQEARVLETSREMRGQDWRGWMIPHTNGAIRLRKPPLAYWLSAGSFALFGVSTAAGRVPAVISAWVTLAFTFLIARRLFNPRAAVWAVAGLLSSYLFMKYMILAETDTLATLFVTIGVYAAMRCFDAQHRFRWQHLMAVAMALGILAKGPPAGFVALFLVGLCAIRREWRPLREFVVSGAIVTLVVLAAPWFVYVLRYAPGDQLGDDLRNSAVGGGGHAGSALRYIPSLLLSLLPWTLVWLGALIGAVRIVARSRREAQPEARSLLTVLLWCGVILIPLCLWGNKQLHYLLPMMPGAAVLLGWALDRAIDPDAPPMHRTLRPVLTAMFYVLLITPAAIFVVAKVVRHRPLAGDWVLIGGLAGVSIAAVWVARGAKGARQLTCVAALSLGAMLAATVWVATLSASTPDIVAAQLRRKYPGADFVFRGPEHLPTVFAMRRIIPVLDDQQLAARVHSPDLVCLERANKNDAVEIPAGYRQADRFKDGANYTAVYVPIERP